jgi:hypothetical protein
MPSAKRPVMSRRSSSYSSYISSYSSCISSISSYSSSYSNWARSIRRRCWSGAYQGDHAAVAECPTVVSGRSRETSVTFGWLPDHTHPYQINNATQRELVMHHLATGVLKLTSSDAMKQTHAAQERER